MAFATMARLCLPLATLAAKMWLCICSEIWPIGLLDVGFHPLLLTSGDFVALSCMYHQFLTVRFGGVLLSQGELPGKVRM